MKVKIYVTKAPGSGHPLVQAPKCSEGPFPVPRRQELLHKLEATQLHLLAFKPLSDPPLLRSKGGFDASSQSRLSSRHRLNF